MVYVPHNNVQNSSDTIEMGTSVLEAPTADSPQGAEAHTRESGHFSGRGKTCDMLLRGLAVTWCTQEKLLLVNL